MATKATQPGLGALLGLLLVSPPTIWAGQVEVAGWIGPSLPFYSQSFRYQPAPVPPLPGVAVEQAGELRFHASGAAAFGGSLAWYGAGPIGLELRLDTSAIEVRQDEAAFRVSVRPPAPLPPLALDVETKGAVTLDRLRPISLDLRYRGGGRVGVVASAGASYLPSLDFTVSQELGVGAISGAGGIEIPTLSLAAGGRIEGFWGMNAGLGLRLELSGNLSAQAEGRGFFFGERELAWRLDRLPAEPELGEALRQQLGPIRFTPGYFQATAGLALRF